MGLLAFVQMVRPGAGMVYGGFTSNVDMKSGAPVFGSPEYVRAVLAGGQLARHLALPYRSSNVNAANAVDAQATYESLMSLWAVVLAHVNLVWHGVGCGVPIWYQKRPIATYFPCHALATILSVPNMIRR